MKTNKIAPLALLMTALYVTSSAAASLTEQWKQGLAGAKLTAYDGSIISNASRLTVINFCSNGRYTYYREGSWTLPGQAGGASQNTIRGRWDISQIASQIRLTYVTDSGESGSFPIYLQANGRVNIGGTAYAAQRGGAGC